VLAQAGGRQKKPHRGFAESSSSAGLAGFVAQVAACACAAAGAAGSERGGAREAAALRDKAQGAGAAYGDNCEGGHAHHRPQVRLAAVLCVSVWI